MLFLRLGSGGTQRYPIRIIKLFYQFNTQLNMSFLKCKYARQLARNSVFLLFSVSWVLRHLLQGTEEIGIFDTNCGHRTGRWRTLLITTGFLCLRRAGIPPRSVCSDCIDQDYIWGGEQGVIPLSDETLFFTLVVPKVSSASDLYSKYIQTSKKLCLKLLNLMSCKMQNYISYENGLQQFVAKVWSNVTVDGLHFRTQAGFNKELQ